MSDGDQSPQWLRDLLRGQPSTPEGVIIGIFVIMFLMVVGAVLTGHTSYVYVETQL